MMCHPVQEESNVSQHFVLTADFEVNIKMTAAIHETLHMVIEGILLEKCLVPPRLLMLKDTLTLTVPRSLHFTTQLDLGNYRNFLQRLVAEVKGKVSTLIAYRQCPSQTLNLKLEECVD